MSRRATLLRSLCVTACLADYVYLTPNSENVRKEGRFVPGIPPKSEISFDQPGFQATFRVKKTSNVRFELSQEIPTGQAPQPHFFLVLVNGERVPSTEYHSFSTEGFQADDFKFKSVSLTGAVGFSVTEWMDVTLYHNTEARWNEGEATPNDITLKSIALDEGAEFEQPAPPSDRRIEVYGDAITTGFDNLCAAAATNGWAAAESVFDAWGSVLCRNLGATCSQVAWSGFGVATSLNGPTTLPDIYQRTAASLALPTWDFAEYTPQLVVVNLGTHDQVTPETQQAFVDKYVALVTSLDAKHGGSAKFALACGPVTQVHCAGVHEAADRIRANGVQAIYLDLPPPLLQTPCDSGFPSIADASRLASVAAEALGPYMGWVGGFSSSGTCPLGSYLALGSTGVDSLPANAFDADPSTAWADSGDFSGASASTWIETRFPFPVQANTYAVFSSTQASDLDPVSWRVLGDGLVIDQQQNIVWGARAQERTFALASTGLHAVYRLEITKAGSFGVAVGEFQVNCLLQPQVRNACPVGFPGAQRVCGEGCNSLEENPYKAFDGTSSTKFLDNLGTDGKVWLQLTHTAPVTAYFYSVTSANDQNDRDPTDWQLLGFPTLESLADGSRGGGAGSVVLDEQKGVLFESFFVKKTFRLDAPGPYYAYRLHVQKTRDVQVSLDCYGKPIIQLSEIGFDCRVPAPTTIAQRVGADNRLSTLFGLVTSPGYEAIAEVLSDDSLELTLFAPSNEAFTAFLAEAGVDLTDTALITALLKYHVLPAAVQSSALLADQYVNTLSADAAYVQLDGGKGQVLRVKASSAGVQVLYGVVGGAEATVTRPDLACSNGVVHVTDRVLAPLPQNAVVTAAAFPAILQELGNALVFAELDEAVTTSTGITIFAPINAALAAVNGGLGWASLDNSSLAELLTYHVADSVEYLPKVGATVSLYRVDTLQGSQVELKIDAGVWTVNGVRILQTVVLSNGVLHIIDAALVPAGFEYPTPAPTVAPSAPAPSPPTKTIVETALATDDLSVLVSVLTTAAYKPVLDALSGDGPFTVFAPTNDAFAKAGIDTSDVAAVTAVLQYHVVGSQVLSTEFAAGNNFAASLQGTDLRINVEGTTVQVNAKATVTTADILCTNGAVHIVDAVIAPIPLSIVGNAQATSALSTLVSVLTTAAYKPVLDALSGDGPFTVFAPTNDAFAKAGIDTSDVAAVTAVLQYHVVANAQIYAGDLTASQSVATLNGKDIVVTKDASGDVAINRDALVILADVQSSNGVVHVIDKVLIPPVTAMPTAAPTDNGKISADTDDKEEDSGLGLVIGLVVAGLVVLVVLLVCCFKRKKKSLKYAIANTDDSLDRVEQGRGGAEKFPIPEPVSLQSMPMPAKKAASPRRAAGPRSSGGGRGPRSSGGGRAPRGSGGRVPRNTGGVRSSGGRLAEEKEGDVNVGDDMRVDDGGW